MTSRAGSIRLFQWSGIQVFLHWSWFIVAAYEIQERKGTYSSVAWNVAEYLVLFAIVTMHEFGHALACKGVGGQASQIVLWPMGGVAFVDPPPRPGATLWSIAAGPLVNVALIPVLVGLVLLSSSLGGVQTSPNLHPFLVAVLTIDIGLLIFNVLPVYPLDGGQILRSLLWYVVGRARSLMAAVIVGFIGVVGFVIFAISIQSGWLVAISLLAALQCFGGFKRAQSLERMARGPHREGMACPKCNAAPPIGRYWFCGSCRRPFDPFETRQPLVASSPSSMLNLSVSELPSAPLNAENTLNAIASCPHCKVRLTRIRCLDCGSENSADHWNASIVDSKLPARSEPYSALSSGFRNTLAADRPAPPSVIPIVLGIMILLAGVLSLAVAALFFQVGSSQAASQPQYQAQIDKLWNSAGAALPGEFVIQLRRGQRYDAYIETSIADASIFEGIDIGVSAADSGQQVTLRKRRTSSVNFKREGRELMSRASFSAPETGRYTVHVSLKAPLPSDARLKIGPSAELANGRDASTGRAIAVVVCAFALLFITAAVVLFLYYRHRRIAFNSSLQRFYGGQWAPEPIVPK